MCWDRVIDAEATQPQQARTRRPSKQDAPPAEPAALPEFEEAPALAEAAR